jgi:hypothetical protein
VGWRDLDCIFGVASPLKFDSQRYQQAEPAGPWARWTPVPRFARVYQQGRFNGLVFHRILYSGVDECAGNNLASRFLKHVYMGSGNQHADICLPKKSHAWKSLGLFQHLVSPKDTLAPYTTMYFEKNFPAQSVLILQHIQTFFNPLFCLYSFPEV